MNTAGKKSVSTAGAIKKKPLVKKPATKAKPGKKKTATSATAIPKKKAGGKKKTETAEEKAQREKQEQEDKEEEERQREREERRKAENERLKKLREEKERKEREKKEEITKQITPNDLGERHIDIVNLELALASAREDGLTPLVIDPSGRVDSFLQYQSTAMIDAKGLFVQVSVHKKVTKDEMLEKLRKKVITAMKNGLTIHICMQNGATTMSDYDDEGHFPLDLIMTPGALTEENTTAIVREEDKKPHGFIVVKETQTIVTSQFQPEDYVEFLTDALPLKKCAPIIVKAAS